MKDALGREIHKGDTVVLAKYPHGRLVTAEVVDVAPFAVQVTLEFNGRDFKKVVTSVGDIVVAAGSK
ncbi:hypothetical protein [Bradyrhizobium sp. USDA 4350]